MNSPLADIQPTSKFESGLFYGFLFLLIWLPLPLGSNRVWAWSLMEAGVFCLSIAWLVLLLRGQVHFGAHFKQAKWIVWLFLCFLLIEGFKVIPLPMSWVSFVSPATVEFTAAINPSLPDFLPISIDPNASINALLKSLSYFFLFCLTLALVRTRKRLLMLAYTLLVCGVFQAFYGSLMTLSGLEKSLFIDKESYVGVATGTFVNRNHLAGYLEMTLAIGIGLMIANLSSSASTNWRERTRRILATLLGPKARIRLALVIMVIALVLTQSRMGNTAFFASLTICAIIGIISTLRFDRVSKQKKRGNRSLIWLFASLLVIDVLIVGAWFGIDKVAERMESTSFASETRDEVSQFSFAIWQDFNILGTGGGSFYGIFPAYNQIPVGGFYDHAHNDYAQFATEFGTIGAGLLALIVIASFIKSIAVQFTSQSQTHRGLAFASCMGILSIMIHSSVDFNLQIPANAALFIVLIALPWLLSPISAKPTI